MVNDLIEIRGTNEQFCSIVFVHTLEINGVLREKFPRQFKWIIKQVQKLIRGGRGARFRGALEKLDIMSLNANNLRHAVKEIYHHQDFFYRFDFGNMLKLLPPQFVEEEVYELRVALSSEEDIARFHMTKVREQAISYLEQKHGNTYARRKLNY